MNKCATISARDTVVWLFMTEYSSYDTHTEELGDPYAAIISEQHIAAPKKALDAESVAMRIVGNSLVSFQEDPIKLQGHGLFALNALLLSSEPATIDTLADHGFDPMQRIEVLGKAIGRLGTRLQSKSGLEVITSEWRNGEVLFGLHPRIYIEDDRQANREDKRSARRQAAFATLVNQYSSDPDVLQYVESLKTKPTNAKEDASSFEDYLRYAGQFNLLDANGEQVLFAKLEEGLAVFEMLPDITAATDDQKALFIETVKAHRRLHLSNLLLVASVAKRYFGTGSLEAIDLVQEGNIGLIKGIARFDHTRGFKFSTYGTWWIEQAIRKVLAESNRTIRLPGGMHDQWLKLQKHRRTLTSNLERDPTPEELAEYTGVRLQTVKLCNEFGALYLPSLDAPIDDDTTLGDLLPDKSESITAMVQGVSDRQELDQLFGSARLRDTEKLILCLRFGTYNNIPDTLDIRHKTGKELNYQEFAARQITSDGITLQEIADFLGLSRERIRQIETTALRAARNILQQSKA